jgi:hypothetical protein
MEIKLSRRELATLFYPGRKLELTACYMPMNAPSLRTVKSQHSYGYEMLRENGRSSSLRFETGNSIIGISPAGNGFTEIKIIDSDGIMAATYRLIEQGENINA